LKSLLGRQGFAAQGLAAQGLAWQGFAAHGFAAHGFAAQGFAVQGLALQLAAGSPSAVTSPTASADGSAVSSAAFEQAAVAIDSPPMIASMDANLYFFMEIFSRGELDADARKSTQQRPSAEWNSTEPERSVERSEEPTGAVRAMMQS
jgi:hypothetical protein